MDILQKVMIYICPKKEIMELLLNISTKHENDFRSIKKEIQQLKNIGPEKG